MAQPWIGIDARDMEGAAALLGVMLGFAAVMSAVLWGIAAMTGGPGEQRRRK